MLFQGHGRCVNTSTLDWSTITTHYNLSVGTARNVCSSDCNCHCFKRIVCHNISELVDNSVLFMAGGMSTNVTVLGEDMHSNCEINGCKGMHTNFLIKDCKDLHKNSLKALPEKTWGPALAYHDGHVYLCGQVFTKQKNICMKYSREDDDWTPIQNLPYDNGYAQAESVNGNLYIFGGNGGKRNVVRYNSDEDSWTILQENIPFDFVSGCSTVLGDCRVLLIKWNGETAVFDAATETFQAMSDFPAVSTMPHCAAVLSRINSTVGVMLTDAGFRKRTHFFQLAPLGSGEWQSFSTNNGYIGPVLGRLSSDTIIMGGSPSIGVKHEMLQKLSPYWENKDYHIPFPTYGRGTQVPKSWIRHPLCG